MADSKISALTTGSAPVATDELVVARSGNPYKLTYTQLMTVPSGTQLLGAAGTIAAPGVTVGSASWGLYQRVATVLGFSIGGGSSFEWTNNGMNFRSSIPLNWASGAPDSTSADTGLARVSAGLVKVTDGSTGSGQLIARTRIVAITGTGNLTAIDSGGLYTNEGDADGAVINLPDNPSYGCVFEFACVVAQNFDIKPGSGESIQDGVSNGTTQIRGSAIGCTLKLTAVTSGSGAVWMVMAKNGTWTLS